MLEMTTNDLANGIKAEVLGIESDSFVEGLVAERPVSA
jgi:hypothetical protein